MAPRRTRILALLALLTALAPMPVRASTSAQPGPGIVDPPVVTSLAGGWEHSCMVRNASVWCTGINAQGQLGTGTFVRSLAFIPSLATNARLVAAGGDTTCAVTTDAALWCWGTLPTGIDPVTQTILTTDTPTPTRITLPPVRSVAVSARHVCALVANGAVWCFGDNSSGQLGDGTTTHSLVPVRALVDSIESLDVSEHHSCAVRKSGSVWCWGSNFYKRLGHPAAGLFPKPRMVPNVRATTGATSVVTGDGFTCIAAMIGRVQCWGRNNHGQLGRTPGSSRARAHTTTIKKPVSLTAGDEFVCAVTEAGTTWCWGRNDVSQIGLTGVDAVPVPRKIIPDLDLGTITAVSAGAAHVCGTLPRLGSLWCWGLGLQGQLGDGGGGRPTGTAVWPNGVRTAPIGSATSARIVAVGDIACNEARRTAVGTGPLGSQCSEIDTAALATEMNPDAVIALGDNQYEAASYDDLATWYEPTWGTLKNRTHPLRGNHEYITPGAEGHVRYFDEMSASYWWTDAGGWRILAVDSWCQGLLYAGCAADSPQTKWLEAELARARAEGRCALVAMHHPFVSSGRLDTASTASLWAAAVNGGADLVLAAHEHFYERFEPLGTDGEPSASGVPLIISGLGGAQSTGFTRTPHNGSAVRHNSMKGLLLLTLTPGGYAFTFQSAMDRSIIDQGSATCAP